MKMAICKNSYHDSYKNSTDHLCGKERGYFECCSKYWQKVTCKKCLKLKLKRDKVIEGGI